MFLLRQTLSSQRIPSCDSSTSLWETYRHEEGLGSDYISKYDGKHLHMAAVASSGHPLAWAAPLKCNIWLHIFINKHRQWWIFYPRKFGRNRARLAVQVGNTSTDGASLHKPNTHSCMQMTSNTTSASHSDLGKCKYSNSWFRLS